MKSQLFIKSRYLDYKCSMVPQSMDCTMKHYAAIETLSWIYNNGKFQTQEDMEQKLITLQEELMALEISGDKQSPYWKAAKERVDQLKFILELED